MGCTESSDRRAGGDTYGFADASFKTGQERTGNELITGVFTPEFFRDPYSCYASLREKGSVHKGRTPNLSTFGSQPCWYILGYKECKEALAGDGRFSSKLFGDAPPNDSASRGTAAQQNWMIFQDEARHKELRAPHNRTGSFSSGMLNELRTDIELIAEEQINDLSKINRPDLMLGFCIPFPIKVISKIVGVPETDWSKIARWSNIFDFPETSLEPHKFLGITSETEEFKAYLISIVEKRKAQPKNDFISRLIATSPNGTSFEHIANQCMLILVAGSKTTTGLIANSFLALDQNPAALNYFEKNGPTEQVIKELIRYDSPVQIVLRRAASDFSFSGKEFKKGDLVLIMVGSANRDPVEFKVPDALDFARSGTQHLSFGFGQHHCFGWNLASLELEVALRALFRRLPTVSFDHSKIQWDRNIIFRGPESLPFSLLKQ